MNTRTFGHRGDKDNRFRWACTSTDGAVWKSFLTELKGKSTSNLDLELQNRFPYFQEIQKIRVPFYLCDAVKDICEFTKDELKDFITSDAKIGDNAYSEFFETVHTFYENMLEENNYYIIN